MFGLYGLVQGPMIILSCYSSEMYRSLGRPRVSTLVQIVFLVLMTPLMTAAAKQGFDAVVGAEAVSRLMLIVINQIVPHFVVNISFGKTIRALKEPIVCTLVMCAFAWLTYGLVAGSCVGIVFDIVGRIVVYFVVCLALPKSRSVLLKLAKGAGLRKVTE